MGKLVVCIAALALLGLLHAPRSQSLGTPAPQELYDCINGPFKSALDSQDATALNTQTTYADFAYMKPTRLKLYKSWWSSKPHAVQVTIVTGLNPSRAEQLEAQCRSWRGPISAAVYVVLHNPDAKDGSLSDKNKEILKEAASQMGQFHERMEMQFECQLDLMLLYETVVDSVMTVLLPINTMRNYGLLAARTRLVAMVDVDLLVSNTLIDWLKAPGNYEELLAGTAKKQVYVLPAFETAPQKNITRAHELADNASMMVKPELAKLVKRRLMYQFALYLFRQGHNCTDYNKWFQADQPYEVEYHDGYEPWFIIDRFMNPFYDSVFRGYGWNKVTHVDNVHGQGFAFIAHPAGFLVHRQHSRSSADQMYQNQKVAYERDMKLKGPDPAKPNNNLAGLTHRFRDQILADMKENKYTPLVDEGVKGCVEQLSWWQGRKAVQPEHLPHQHFL